MKMNKTVMTFREVTDMLREAGVPDPLHDGRELWRAFGGEGLPYPPMPTDKSESPRLTEAVERRAKREPLQYILGSVSFYREEYIVSPDCLIPRQDTEILVDLAVKRLSPGARFADLCTGSGCIAISTLANTEDTTALAADISDKALSVARLNAEKNGVLDRLSLIKCDLMAKTEELTKSRFDAVLSNPPYVSSSDYSALDCEIFKEPSIAFLGGEDGGDFYRRLVPLAKEMILPSGFIAFEIGFDQGGLLQALAEEHQLSCEIIKDYSGLDRVALLTFG